MAGMCSFQEIAFLSMTSLLLFIGQVLPSFWFLSGKVSLHSWPIVLVLM